MMLILADGPVCAENRNGDERIVLDQGTLLETKGCDPEGEGWPITIFQIVDGEHAGKLIHLCQPARVSTIQAARAN